MSSGRAAKTKNDDGFAKRTVLAMVHDMKKARVTMNRVCTQFEALATTHGIKVTWDEEGTPPPRR